ncbi:MAG: signal peptidase I [Bdellovibrionales bacterium]|nr:signal peptidase I [Bdellovibrionales bacterium]
MSQSKRDSKKALLFSLVMPGLGQVYNGEVSKGISLFLIFAFSIPGFSWLALNGPNFSLWILVLLGVLFALGVYVLSCTDAFKRAKAIGEGYQLGPYNKSYVYLSMLFFGYFFVLSQLVTYTKTNLVELYHVPSTSMRPGLEKGDFFFVDKDVNAPGCKRKIKRGDIATFVYPNDRTTIYVKRIIGLPGDKIEMSGTDVKINGQSITQGDSSTSKDHLVVREKAESGETYEVYWKPASQGSQLSLTVPDGQVFVLGDNRDDAYDSRKFGTLPLTDINGIAKQVWFSLADAGLRIGKWVDAN